MKPIELLRRTPRRRAAKAARDAELRRLNAILDHAADAIITTDADGQITEWNLGAEALYGYARAEAVGRSIGLIIPPGGEDEDRRLLARALAGETIREYESVRRRRDGTLVEISLTLSPLRDANGRPDGAARIARAIGARKQLERQLQGLFEHAPAGISLRDLDGRYLRVNGHLADLFGRTPESMIGLHPSDQHPDAATQERVRAEDAEILATGAPKRGVYRLPQPDGTIRDYEVIRYPVRNAGGEIDGFGSYAVDVTEQRQSESDRDATLIQLAEAQRIARVGSWSWEPATQRGQWSAQTYRIFGHEPDAATASLNLLAYVHTEERDAVAEALERTLADGEDREVDCRVLTLEGVERTIHISARRERAGEVGGTVQDVTEWRAIEQAARAAADHLQMVLENAPIGMALVAPEGNWLQVNRALCEIVGYDETELRGLTFQAITHPDDLDADLGFVAQLLSGEVPHYQMEKRYIHRDGHEVWVLLTVSLVRDAQGEPDYFISQIQDITSERQAREALAESERRFSSIAANVPGVVYRYSRDDQGRTAIPFASAGSEDVYGVSPELLMADPSRFIANVHPDDAESVTASIETSARDLSRWEGQWRQLGEDGQIKYLRAVAQPAREADGTTVWDGVITDETHVHAAREAENATRRRLQLILENLAGSAVAIFDRELHLQMCEGPLFAHLDPEQLIGRHVSETSGPETQAAVVPAMQRALAGQASTVIVEADSEGRTLAVRVAPYREGDGAIVGALVHWHDISSVRQAEQARDQALDRFRIAFERAPIGMAIVGDDGRFQRVNQAICDITGHTAEALVAMPAFDLVHPDSLAAIKGAFSGLGLVDDSVTLEHRITHADGEPRWVQARFTLIRDPTGEPLHALAQILDITERRQHEERLQHLADHDPLSGLLNRRGFETELAGHLARCRRYTPTGALLMLDLDGFKRVNDVLGHAAGDEVLVGCAAALKTRLRESDVVARLGGDEFAVLLPEQDAAGASEVARSLIASLRAEAAERVGTEAVTVTVSVGIACFTAEALDSDAMLSHADLAMYEAKQGGKDRYALHGRPAVSPVLS